VGEGSDIGLGEPGQIESQKMALICNVSSFPTSCKSACAIEGCSHSSNSTQFTIDPKPKVGSPHDYTDGGHRHKSHDWECAR
jgi:hypothetical protein